MFHVEFLFITHFLLVICHYEVVVVFPLYRTFRMNDNNFITNIRVYILYKKKVCA